LTTNHFPFVISHFSFVIASIADVVLNSDFFRVQQHWLMMNEMKNEK